MTRSRRIVGIVVTLMLSAVLLYAASPVAIEVAQRGEFSTDTAIVIAGYVLRRVLGLLAVGLPVIALLLLAGAAIERRGQRAPK